jgi:hypothetical protein
MVDLEASLVGKAVILLLADDDMILQVDIEQLACFLYFFGEG